MWRAIFMVALGGAVGSVCRFLIGNYLHKFHKTDFPLSTLVINISGCLAIGFFTGLLQREVLSQDFKLILVAGFCGGFTTFSSFGQENLALLSTNQILLAALNTALSFTLGILAVWCGQQLAQ